jgi:CBS domain-containing protein
MFESLRNAKISEFVESRPLLSEGERVSKATGLLRVSGEYEVFVTKEGHLAMASVRDLLSVKNPDTERVGAISSYAPSLGEDETIERAATLMFQYRLRALPLEGSKGVAKVIPAGRILPELKGSEAAKVKASQLMTSNLTTLSTKDTAEKARQVMMQRTFDHLPILDGTKLVGILTSSQLLFRLLPEEGIPSQFRGREVSRLDFPAAKIAEEITRQVSPSDTLTKVLDVIRQNRSSYVLVTEAGTLKGIITFRDIMSMLVRKEKAPLPFYIVGLPDDPFEAESAKTKFERIGTALTRSFPFIEEIRAVVKTKRISDSRRRYEVTVNVYSPGATYAYAAGGFDLAKVFEELGLKLKALLASRQSRVTKTQGGTLRKRMP